ncbi:translation initiation factor eIF2B subunit-like protein, putative, partial [Bodo saltans]
FLEIFRSIHTLVEEKALRHIKSGDCILTYGRSSSIELILQHAVTTGLHIRVIVVDCGPLYEGKTFAARLQSLGIPVTYGLLTAICSLLPSCNKVMIGASAVLQSGEVYSRAGTATVATAAKAFRKPVLCMCESHKFVPKVWIGSLVQNSEVGDLQQRRPVGVQSQNINVHVDQATKPWPQREQNPSGYLYDLTPASAVDMVICEMGCLSTSGIAAAIRDRQDRELFMQ